MRNARPVHSWRFWPTRPAGPDRIQQQPDKQPCPRSFGLSLSPADKAIVSDLEYVAPALRGIAPTTALALTKWLFYKLDSLSFDDGIAAGVVTNVEARSTEDFKKGVRKFTERRSRPE